MPNNPLIPSVRLSQSRAYFLGALLCSLLLLGNGWCQPGSPTVYVSGTGGVILSINTANGATTTLMSNANAAYEGLVVGPDNVAGDNPAHPFLLYACDPTHNTIIRFDPSNVGAGVETIYSGGALQQPQCGRFTNTGDLIVSSKVAGSGIWKIAGVTNIALGAGGFPAPAQNPPKGVFSGTQVSQGLAQKNIGDLLVVDAANKQVIRSQYATIPAFSGLPGVFIAPSALLPGPIGIARKSAGDIYVSNQSKKANNVVHYSAQGTNGSVCASFGKLVPSFMQISADDTLYVATAATSSGTLFSVNTDSCVATPVATQVALPQLIGVALPPTQVTQTKNFNGTQLFNFGFTAYQFTSGGACTLTVTAAQTNLAVINANIANAQANDPADLPLGGSPAVNLGADGFEYALTVTTPNPIPCAQFADGTSTQLLATEVDNLLASNPRMVRCGTAGDPDPGVCGVIEALGSYPLGGLLPQDSTYGGKGSQCQIFAVNSNLSANEPAIFCGFQSPLSNVQPPGIAGVFGTGQNLSIKFKLASTSGNCQNGPYVNDAVALLSVAQIFDAKGNAVFNPIPLDASGNSTPVQPIFKSGNNQYQFSLSLQGYASGIYSLTVTFLSSNTVQQTVEFQVP